MHGCLCNNQRYEEISRNTGYLLSNIYVGIGEITGMGYNVDDMQMMQTVELQWMMSHGSCMKQLHKLITQNNHTN